MQDAMFKFFADKRAKQLTSTKIKSFVQALRIADDNELQLMLTKRELLHLINHIPLSGIQLGVCMDSSRVEASETGDALTEEQEDIILGLVKEHLL
jgi:hypothetical protein